MDTKKCSEIYTHVLDDFPVVKDSTVSRVVTNTENLRYVHFAFAVGQSLPEYASTRQIVLQVLSGQILLHIDGREEHILGTGDFAYIRPSTAHWVRAIEESHVALTMLKVADEIGSDDTYFDDMNSGIKNS
ncbi:cupin domain-containing protein [Actinotignum urinale]|uniref:Cupin domain-containing protein n=1 Tax=Actinotignum urinale TaxID=190146 RepID=A0AAW9HW12_9ACTO|nr:cupin domain-containing protein [Actinotignum urinale]MDY5154542.1 cupin domain-containing protein [Actinotignum urinale]